MLIILFAVHCLIAIALVGVVLLQKSDGGALGSIGGGTGMSGFMTGRSTSNLLTRTTAILAAIFFATSILLVKFSTYHGAPTSIIDLAPGPTAPLVPNALSPKNPAAKANGNTPGDAAAKPAAPGEAAPKPAAPAAPAGPSVPLAK